MYFFYILGEFVILDIVVINIDFLLVMCYFFMFCRGLWVFIFIELNYS